jgi:hypothetical protein
MLREQWAKRIKRKRMKRYIQFIYQSSFFFSFVLLTSLSLFVPLAEQHVINQPDFMLKSSNQRHYFLFPIPLR